MRIGVLVMLVGLLVLTLAPGGAAAQQPGMQYRQGFWIGFGLGPGVGQIDCERCGPLVDNDPWDGGTGVGFYLAMGGTPRPNLLVGGEINGYGRRNDAQNREATLSMAGVVVQFYPAPASRLFLKGNAGFGGYRLAGAGDSVIEGQGWALQAGVGYDLLLTRRFALVPHVNVVQVFAESAEGRNQGQAVFGPENPRYLQFGLGFQWY
jgi:hypothetical protein